MLRRRLQEDLQNGLRKGNRIATSVLRMVLSAVVNKEKEKRAKLAAENPSLSKKELEERSLLSDEEILNVLRSEAKKRREALLAFEKGGRRDLSEKERSELQVLEAYLPQQCSDEEIRKVVEKIIHDLDAKGLQDKGKVMAKAMHELRGRADGGRVSTIANSMLGGAKE